ncbi:MAG: hypothetical protein AAGJ32_08545 [Pseudomonadota bacterium]
MTTPHEQTSPRQDGRYPDAQPFVHDPSAGGPTSPPVNAKGAYAPATLPKVPVEAPGNSSVFRVLEARRRRVRRRAGRR